MATELVAEQAPGALHVITEERGSDGKEPDGAAVELETPDVADAMSEQLRLHSILSFKNAEADFANHRRVARAVPIHAKRHPMASYCFEARDSDSQTMLEFRSRIQHVLGTEERLMQSERVLSLPVSGQDYPVRCPGRR